MFQGWTRLLDEWVVGLTRYNQVAPEDPVCWEDPGRTLSTLADAATRVRSFAYRDAEVAPTEPLDDGTLSLELQGRMYRIATEQHWPSDPVAMTTLAGEWLATALTRARAVVQPDEVAVGVVFVTPRLAPSASGPERFESGERFVEASRLIKCRGCAFSFPSAHELDRYRYGNGEHPGALILVAGSATGDDVSA